jgi:uncharacterized protein with FMN-binding domain
VAETRSNKKVSNSLVALSSAAVLAVYSAGYQRTQAAAERFERLAASRRHAVPVPAAAGRVAATAMPVASPAPAPGVALEGTGSAATDAGRAAPGPQPSSPAGPAPASVVPVPATPGASADSTPPPAAQPGVTPVPAVPATPPTPEAQPTANAAPDEIAPITPPPPGRFKDGTYQGRGSCIHGDIQAQVVVKNGRIIEATISSCETRYSCDWLDPILPQVAARQSAFVDYVSGATDSTDAFSAAVTDALLKAQ